MFLGIMYFYVLAFGVMLCCTGVGAIFGIPLILLAEEFRKDWC